MSNSQYYELDKLIKEYDEDIQTIRSERLVIKNYPKVFVMSAASSFEFQIKRRCHDFINAPRNPINSHYPNINLIRQNRRKPPVDQMFAKLEGYDSDGVETLSATKFYDLFGGQAFKTIVESYFTNEISSLISTITDELDGLNPLRNINEQYELEYIKQSDTKEELDRCSFDEAERSYLSLKLRRNRVAHDYLNGLSDTFEDIKKFYIRGVIYVIALEKAIISLTST